ncbi:hypothetical protein ACE6ED_12450 [Paenibacillus sp. CN-4]|uniref:prenylated flavin chaperone LpdD n=1 Tax=Paenibacillus nanchangensis TaxID=3348343 RepID=UPI00397E7889
MPARDASGLPDDITITELRAGADRVLLITGGAAHIGASSTAYAAEGKIRVDTSAVPGHKEYTLSADFARRAAEALRVTVTVIMGIHYDDLTPEQLGRVIQSAESKFSEYLSANCETAAALPAYRIANEPFSGEEVR